MVSDGRNRLTAARRRDGDECEYLPHEADAEEQVIGSLLLAPERVAEVAANLRPGDFVDELHAAAFGVLVTMHRDCIPIGTASVKHELSQHRAFSSPTADAGLYLYELLIAVPTSAHVDYFVGLVTEASRKRRLCNIAGQFWHNSLNGKTSGEVLSDLGADLDAFRADEPSTAQSTTQVFDAWEQRVLGRERPRMFWCGPEGSRLRHLEIGAGVITTLAAPPSKGKSALAHQLITDALLQPGQEHLRALIASVEMQPASIFDRQLARFSGVPYHQVRHRTWPGAAEDRIRDALDELRQLLERVTFLAPPFSIERATAEAKRTGSDLVLLDYLQRFSVGAGDGVEDPRIAVNRMMGHCRSMADQGRGVLVVSAVNRQGYSPDTAGLASRRESGELEFASDAVYLLHLDDKRGPQTDATLRCVKARDAELGEIRLTFEGGRMQLRSEPEFAPHEDFADYDQPGDFDPWTQ